MRWTCARAGDRQEQQAPGRNLAGADMSHPLKERALRDYEARLGRVQLLCWCRLAFLHAIPDTRNGMAD